LGAWRFRPTIVVGWAARSGTHLFARSTDACHDQPMRILVRVVINAVALWLAALLVDGITLGEPNETGTTVLTALLVGAIFGIANVIVKPILTILSIPFIIVTLGLFLIVINALMLGLTSWLADLFGLPFHVSDFFWDAILGAIIVSVVSWGMSFLVPERP
jgi:putative membrane protein